MTHEENFQRIENALRHSAEIQAQHAEQIAESERKIEQNAAAIGDLAGTISDLVVVSRTLVDSHGTLEHKVAELAESQRGTRGVQRESERINPGADGDRTEAAAMDRSSR